MHPVIFKQAEDGRFLAVRNWRHRQRVDDAMVAEPLTTDQLQIYRRQKDAGLTDEAIFDQLFCAPVDQAVAIPMEELSREQIRQLLERLTGAPLPSLTRGSRRDLLALLRLALPRPEQSTHGTD